MKRRKKLLLIGSLVIVAVLLWWATQSARKPVSLPTASRPSPSVPIATVSRTSVPTQDETERRKTVIDNILNVLGTSISFYGKVVDQNGAPVPDVNIQYGAIDKFDADGSHYEGKSDAKGNFSINGIKGAVLTVGVWKDGYYNINDVSDGSFAYGVGTDPTRKEPPTKDHPAVFVLQKMGTTEALIQIAGRQIDIPKTGHPLNIDFTTDQIGHGNLQVESWMGEKAQGRFDWRYQLCVPGGGLVERKGQLDFEAPADGYQPAIEVNMPANATQWSSRLTRQYFAKLADGRYARFSIRFYPGDRNDSGDRNFVVLESYLNPTPGSRNLEFDPAKALKSP